MKNIVFYAAVVLLSLVPVVSFAADFRMGEHPSVNSSEQVSTDLYLTGSEVASAGSVAGDITAGGMSVVLSGPVSTDILVAGSAVTILSTVGDDVRAAAGTLIVGGAVGGDVVGLGGTVTLSGPGVAGDVALLGGTIHVDAPIGGNVRIGGGQVYLNAPINGNVEINAEKVVLGSGAVINGSLHYKATAELTKEDGAVVRGAVTFEQVQDRQHKSMSTVMAGLFTAWTIGMFFSLLLGSLLIGLLLKRFSKTVVEKVRTRPWMEIGRGFLLMVTLPVLSVIAFITLVGIPFGILGVVAFISLLVFAWFLAPIVLGSFVYRYFTKRDEVSWKTILLGVVLYVLIGLIPFVGMLVLAVLKLATLGVFTIIKWNSVQEWR